MRTFVRAAAATAAIAFALACGGSSGGSSPASSSEVAQYRQLAVQVQSAAVDYGTTMAGSDIIGVSDCQRAEDQYDAPVRSWISRMMQMSADLDSLVAEHQGAMHADMGCDSETMMSELDHHRSVACASSHLDIDRAEAARHVQAMMGYTDHATARCDEMASGFAGHGWSWSPMMSGCQSMPGGGMMPGGSMMGAR